MSESAKRSTSTERAIRLTTGKAYKSKVVLAEMFAFFERGLRLCTLCEKEKPFEEFDNFESSHKKGRCKDCMFKYRQTWRNNRRSLRQQQARERGRKHTEEITEEYARIILYGRGLREPIAQDLVDLMRLNLKTKRKIKGIENVENDPV